MKEEISVDGFTKQEVYRGQRIDSRTHPDQVAFPSEGVGFFGLTKREYIATHLLAGMMANQAYNTAVVKQDLRQLGLQMEMLAVKTADCLIQTLNEIKPEKL